MHWDLFQFHEETQANTQTRLPAAVLNTAAGKRTFKKKNRAMS